MLSKNINLKYEGKKYDIEYKRTDNVLYFKDKNGTSIGFVKKNGVLSVFVSNEYSTKMWKKYPALKGTNAYTLAPTQVKIFLEWFNEGKSEKD